MLADGEDLVAVVVQDELVFEIPRPRWRWAPPSNPEVAALSVFKIFLSLQDDSLIGPTISAEVVAVKMLSPLLIVLAGEGVGVQRDDRDLAPAVRVAAVGQEVEDSGLIPNLRR